MKTVQLKSSNGYRNDVSVERFAIGDLAVADNVDVDETGKTWRRLGTEQIANAVVHSLKGFGDFGLAVVNGVLSHITEDGATTPLVSGIKDRVCYVLLNGHVYWSDGVRTGAIIGTQAESWGVSVPSLPAVASTNVVGGAQIMYTMTYVKHSGLESGAPLAGVTDERNTTFIDIPVPTDPAVVAKRLYMSAPNGETLYLAAELPVAQTTFIAPAAGPKLVALRTQFMGPPPAGEVLGYFNGRLYVGAGRFLWYSQPYEYELFDLTSGFIVLDSNIRTISPVNTGIFVGTETETMFLQGTDPSEFVRIKAAPYGTVLGTEAEVRNDILLEKGAQGMSPVWMSKTGLCLGQEGGSVLNLTSQRFIMPPVSEGASLMKIRSGTPQLISTLFA